jgi:hypothetical protein
MNPDSFQLKSGLSPHWHEALVRAGFAMNGDGHYHRDKTSFRNEGRWLQLETVTSPPPPDLVRDLGRPGLWKHIGEGQAGRRVFEFPATAVCPDDEAEWSDEPTPARLDAFLAWALASEKDGVAPGWQPPARALVESWLMPGALTVQAGPIVRQGELILTPDRWAVRFLILPVVPADLPFVRRDWLRAVLSDAQTLWRLVRLGFASEGENLAVACEVDFTGAPVSENLFLAGVHGVRHVVGTLAETVELLSDATIASQALKLAPSSNPQPERSQTP